MTSSNKKKRNKIETFKKQKLRVGKTPAKAANFTNTSFKSKAIVLATQSLGLSAPALHSQFSHHLSLLSHHANITRKESLTFLTSHLHSGSIPIATLVPKLAPLILDVSDSVRAQLLTLLALLRPAETRIHMSLLLLHIWSAMSHIDPDIRSDSTKFLSWALATAPEETLANGGWGKGLGALSGVLGFSADAGPRGIKGAKNMLRHLGVLKEFLVAGMGGEEDVAVVEKEESVVGGLHWSSEVQLKRAGVGAFRYLGLFVEVKESDEGTGGEDKEGRRRWCAESRLGKEYAARMRTGLVGLTKEGGEVGRTAGRVLLIMEKGAARAVEEVCYTDRDGVMVQ